MNSTKIDYADSTWNPVTVCLHNCEYCYARGIAHRFSGISYFDYLEAFDGDRHFKAHRIAYPAGFMPTFHRYRLNEPQRIKKPRNIFVCGMADLFGDWAPDELIKEVFAACAAAPQHRYLFLTKNPKRYDELAEKEILPMKDNYWYGSTATAKNETFWWSKRHNAFVSIEPILSVAHVDEPVKKVDWVIIGAESGNRKGKVIPKREWLENIVENCRATGTPVFMKSSLAKIWGEPLIQEYPWEVKRND